MSADKRVEEADLYLGMGVERRPDLVRLCTPRSAALIRLYRRSWPTVSWWNI